MMINCDMGEGVPHEPQLFPYIDLCSVACGGHTGNRQTIRRTLELARENHVRAGAHPSYPDPEFFGRRSVQISPEALLESLSEQLQVFSGVARSMEMPVHHIKAHGALYNDLNTDHELATMYLECMESFRQESYILHAAGSALCARARSMGFMVLEEAFADRVYLPTGQLKPRSAADAVITAPGELVIQASNIVKHQRVAVAPGQYIPMKADTLCVHGDNPQAPELLKVLHSVLKDQRHGQV